MKSIYLSVLFLSGFFSFAQTAYASSFGPQSSINCPAGAVDIFPGANIQSVVDANPGLTTFCIRAGIYYLKSSIIPKSGNTFIGEYGAILDGTGWATTV